MIQSLLLNRPPSMSFTSNSSYIQLTAAWIALYSFHSVVFFWCQGWFIRNVIQQSVSSFFSLGTSPLNTLFLIAFSLNNSLLSCMYSSKSGCWVLRVQSALARINSDHKPPSNSVSVVAYLPLLQATTTLTDLSGQCDQV
jgi:hypothetical protein